MSERRVKNLPKASAALAQQRSVLPERRRSPAAPIVVFFDLVYAFAINQLTRSDDCEDVAPVPFVPVPTRWCLHQKQFGVLN